MTVAAHRTQRRRDTVSAVLCAMNDSGGVMFTT